MSTTLPFPKSFPNKDELLFLNLLLCKDEAFRPLFEQWKKNIVLDDIDYATLRLLPLLYIRLKKGDNSDPVIAKVGGVYKLAWVKNQRILDRLGKVSELLRAHEIRMIVLKGIPLLIDVYKDVGARFLGDADILIHPLDAKKAIGLLIQSGFQLKTPHFPSLEKFSVESLPRVVKEAPCIDTNGVEIDLHWRLFESTGKEKEILSFDVLWDNSVPIQFKGIEYKSASPEDMLMHVIVHGAEANVHRTLRWVVDAVAIIKAYDIDWEKFCKNVKKYNWNTEMYFAFSFLVEYQFVAVPELSVQSLFSTLSQKDIKRYYKKANVPYSVWGGVPRLWRTYWRYESKGSFPVNLYNFFNYLSLAWGFSKKRELMPFIFDKCMGRMVYYKDEVVRSFLRK